MNFFDNIAAELVKVVAENGARINTFSTNPDTSAAHLHEMAEKLPAVAVEDEGKANRYIGYIHGVLVHTGITDVNGCRDMVARAEAAETAPKRDGRNNN